MDAPDAGVAHPDDLPGAPDPDHKRADLHDGQPGQPRLRVRIQDKQDAKADLQREPDPQRGDQPTRCLRTLLIGVGLAVLLEGDDARGRVELTDEPDPDRGVADVIARDQRQQLTPPAR